MYTFNLINSTIIVPLQWFSWWPCFLQLWLGRFQLFYRLVVLPVIYAPCLSENIDLNLKTDYFTLAGEKLRNVLFSAGQSCHSCNALEDWNILPNFLTTIFFQGQWSVSWMGSSSRMILYAWICLNAHIPNGQNIGSQFVVLDWIMAGVEIVYFADGSEALVQIGYLGFLCLLSATWLSEWIRLLNFPTYQGSINFACLLYP